jgi:hypothetical protein
MRAPNRKEQTENHFASVTQGGASLALGYGHYLTIPVNEPAHFAVSMAPSRYRRVRCCGMVRCQVNTKTHKTRHDINANTAHAITPRTSEMMAGTNLAQIKPAVEKIISATVIASQINTALARSRNEWPK